MLTYHANILKSNILKYDNTKGEKMTIEEFEKNFPNLAITKRRNYFFNN